MDRLDTRSLLELTVKAADSMILTAKQLERDEITPNKANAMVNSYRSAGNLYLAVIQTVEGSTVFVQHDVTPTELSQADKERLDQIAKLLGGDEKPRRNRKKAGGKEDDRGKESKGN